MRLLFVFVLGFSCLARGASDWTLIMLPDTQHYGLTEYASIGNWISTNAASINLQAVIGLGDIVETNSDTGQYNLSTNLYYKASAVVPSLPVLGNHDTPNLTNGLNPRDTYTNFNSFYGQSYFTNKPWWSGGFYSSTNSENWYFRKAIQGTNFLFFGLEFGPRDAVLNWCSNTVFSFPNDKVIICTHGNITEDGWQTGINPANGNENATVYYSDANNGNTCWYKSFRTFSNLFLVANGHHLACDDTQIRRSTIVGDNGNRVMQFICNFQTCATAPWIRLLTFHPDLNTCDATTYQTAAGTNDTAAPHQFTFTTFDTGWNHWPVVFQLNDAAYLNASSQLKPDVSITNNLISYWKLDETSGTRIDSFGTNNLTSNNSVGSSAGKILNAAVFLTASSNSLSVPSNTSISSTNNAYWLGGWCMLTSKTNTSPQHFIGKVGGDFNEYELFWDNVSDRFVGRYWNGGYIAITNNAFGAPTINQWIRLDHWYDPVGKTLNIVANNGTINSVSTGTTNHVASTNDFRLGRSGTANYLNGKIDETGLWKRTPTSNDLVRVYNGGAGITIP